MSRSSVTLLCVFVVLGAGIGMVTATASEPKTEENKALFSTSSIRLWWSRHYGPSIGWWWRRPHPKKPIHIAPAPSPLHNAASPTHAAPSLAPTPSLAPAPITSCMKMDDCLPDLIRSVLRRKISLSSQCCKVVSIISDDCFYQGFTHSKRVPFFVSKVRNYCSHIAPSPYPLHNAASPTHAAPSPIDHVVLAPHTTPSLAPTPTTSCMKMDDCVPDLIRSVLRRKISLSSQCCEVVSIISDDCFYRGFTHSKKVPFFTSKVRNYCNHHQG